ncbi:MAG: hypothetical protein VB852_07225 [Deltaproteobacteria bacterium]
MATEPAKVVLLLGDAELVLPAARKIIDQIVAPANQATDLEILRATEFDEAEAVVGRLAAACSQVGMFNPQRCVWLRDLTPAATEAVVELFEDPAFSGASVVITAASLDKRTRASKQLLALAELHDLSVASGHQGRLDGTRLEELVSGRVTANGLPRPDAQTLRAITARAGAQIGELLTEVDRLCLLAEVEHGLSAQTVATHMRDQAGAWIFDLTDAISERRLADAEGLIERLLGAGEAAPRIVGLVSNQLGDLCAASAALDDLGRPRLEKSISGFSSGTYKRLPGLLQGRWKRPARAYYLMHGAARFTTAELVGLNRKLLDVDVALKSTRLEPLHLFSRFLAQACRQGRRQS